jgi:serine/threonine-protein kinase RsbW
MTMETARHSFDSTLESAYMIEDLVLEIARRAGFRGPSLDHISLAVHETAVNAVVHGNRYSSEKKVQVEISVNEDRLQIKISDEGAGFNAEELLARPQPGDLMRASGRGVSLSRQVMDEYTVRTRSSGGTEVTLTKYLATQLQHTD